MLLRLSSDLALGTARTACSYGESVARDIERRIRQRTCGRVGDIKVQISGGQLVVSGQSRTYYGKQLALQAILDVVGKSERIEFNVDVFDEPLYSADRTESVARPQRAAS